MFLSLARHRHHPAAWRAAWLAARNDSFANLGVVLTARSEGFVWGRPDVDETIRRLVAWRGFVAAAREIAARRTFSRLADLPGLSALLGPRWPPPAGVAATGR